MVKLMTTNMKICPTGRITSLLWVAAALYCSGLVTPLDADARRRVRYGTLTISSSTAGAEIYVDSKLVGKVPVAEPFRLKAGKHTLKLVKEGYTQYLDVFTVTRGQNTQLDIDLLPVAGIFAITADVPKARVYVDGTFAGTTPLEVEALVGKRTVRVTKAGYHDFIKTIKAVAGQKLATQVKMVPLPVGTSPYRPAPPPPPKWYERWYVWAGAAGGLMAVAVAIVVPVVMTAGNPIDDFGPEFRWKVQ